jgi:glutaredoxin
MKKHTGQSLISQNEIKNCSHNKFAKRIYTDRLECLDDFLKIGWIGKIGVYYQYILLDIIKNKAFAREIMKYIDHLKNSIAQRKKMILAI